MNKEETTITRNPIITDKLVNRITSEPIKIREMTSGPYNPYTETMIRKIVRKLKRITNQMKHGEQPTFVSYARGTEQYEQMVNRLNRNPSKKIKVSAKDTTK